jgi:hypothetical protein
MFSEDGKGSDELILIGIAEKSFQCRGESDIGRNEGLQMKQERFFQI